MKDLAIVNGKNNEVSMTTVEIAERTGKEHFNVLIDTRKMLKELYGKGGDLKFQGSYKSEQNKELPCYRLPKREILVLVSGYSIKLRAAIIDRLEELEKHNALPNFNDPVAAARAWADAQEAAAKALSDRDEAIRTKAQISDKKTATAMATASKEKRRRIKLEEQIGIAENWKQVIAIDWLQEFFDINKKGFYSAAGKELTKISRQLGLEKKTVPHSKYGKVGVYHISAIEELEARIILYGALSKYSK